MKIKTKWDLSPLYKSPNDPQIDNDRKIVLRESYKFINKWKDRDDYLKDPKTLKAALDEYNHWVENYGSSGKEGYFLFLKSSLDENDPTIKARMQKLSDFSVKISNDIQFFEMRVSKIPAKEQNKFLNSPLLKEYRHYLKRAFDSSKHLLTEPEEKILNLQSGPAFGKWVNMVSGFVAKEEAEVIDEDGKKKKKNISEIGNLLPSHSEKSRKSAYLAIKNIAKKHSETAEAEFNAILEYKKINDELRNFKRPDAARHLSDDIESEVVDAMTQSVVSYFDLAKRYYKFKAKLFKVKKLAPWNVSAPYGQIKKKYSFDEAVKIVDRAFTKIDPEFSAFFRKLLQDGSIDVYPKRNKTGGGFCVNDHIKSTPHYILLNFDGTVRNITTVAHEMGHAINHELTKKKQKGLNEGVSLATAEVASTFTEDFAFRELALNVSEEGALSLLMQDIEESIGSCIRMVSAYNFEKRLHEAYNKEGYLTKERISRIFGEEMTKSMGTAIDQKETDSYKWVIWPHFRMFFYVYSYSSGLLISKALQRKLRENPKFIEKIKDFLSAGSSDSPKNIFKNLGIDIEDKKFWSEGLKEIEGQIKEAEKLAKKLGKI